MRTYAIFTIAMSYRDLVRDEPNIEESLKFACKQILQGYADEADAMADIENLNDTGDVRFTVYGWGVGSYDVRAALDLNEKFGWNLIKR